MELHQLAFEMVLQAASKHGLLKGTTVGVDAFFEVRYSVGRLADSFRQTQFGLEAIRSLVQAGCLKTAVGDPWRARPFG